MEARTSGGRRGRARIRRSAFTPDARLDAADGVSRTAGWRVQAAPRAAARRARGAAAGGDVELLRFRRLERRAGGRPRLDRLAQQLLQRAEVHRLHEMVMETRG